MLEYDSLFAHHCGAVLLGKKPAALFTCPSGQAAVAAMAAMAAENDLLLMEMRCRQGRALLLVYQPRLLRQALEKPVARKMLCSLGYPVQQALGAMLAHLRARTQAEAGFPHEIGFFLGYPPADVVGFIWHGGRNCQHRCMWKVYGNVEAAKKLCGEYEHCSRLCSEHVAGGGSLAALSRQVRTAALAQ